MLNTEYKMENKKSQRRNKELEDTNLMYSQEKSSMSSPSLREETPKQKIWTTHLIKEVVAVSMLLVLATSTGLFLLGQTTSPVATTLRNKVEEVSNIGRRLVSDLSSGLIGAEQLAAISFFSTADKFFENVSTGFNNLKELALRRVFLSQSPLETEVTPPSIEVPTKDTEDSAVAVTNATQSFNTESLKT